MRRALALVLLAACGPPHRSAPDGGALTPTPGCRILLSGPTSAILDCALLTGGVDAGWHLAAIDPGGSAKVELLLPSAPVASASYVMADFLPGSYATAKAYRTGFTALRNPDGGDLGDLAATVELDAGLHGTALAHLVGPDLLADGGATVRLDLSF